MNNPIRSFIKIDKVRNDCSRIQYLLNRIQKDEQALKELGVDIIVQANGLNETFLKECIYERM